MSDKTNPISFLVMVNTYDPASPKVIVDVLDPSDGKWKTISLRQSQISNEARDLMAQSPRGLTIRASSFDAIISEGRLEPAELISEPKDDLRVLQEIDKTNPCTDHCPCGIFGDSEEDGEEDPDD